MLCVCICFVVKLTESICIVFFACSQVQDGHGGTPLAHMLINEALNRPTVETCFEIFRQYDPEFVNKYVASSGGFDGLWEQSRSGEHFDAFEEDEEDEDAGGGEKEGQTDNIDRHDSMAQAAMQGMPGFLVDSNTENGTLPPPPPPHGDRRTSTLIETDEDEETDDEDGSGIDPEYNMNGQLVYDTHRQHNTPPPPPPPLPQQESASALAWEKLSPTSPPPSEDLLTEELSPLRVSPTFCCCNNGHHLKWTVLNYSWDCDRCGISYHSSVPAHGCKLCEYDICDQCCRNAWETHHPHDEERPYVIPSGIVKLVKDQSEVGVGTVYGGGGSGGGDGSMETDLFVSTEEIQC